MRSVHDTKGRARVNATQARHFSSDVVENASVSDCFLSVMSFFLRFFLGRLPRQFHFHLSNVDVLVKECNGFWFFCLFQPTLLHVTTTAAERRCAARGRYECRSLPFFRRRQLLAAVWWCALRPCGGERIPTSLSMRPIRTAGESCSSRVAINISNALSIQRAGSLTY